MPLEISEIAIRLVVGDPARGSLAGTSAVPDAQAAPAAGLSPHEIDELVRRCVNDVLATLRLSGER
ncbi:DUF5908 family protein [Novosphingobium sp. FSW06-99]|uniref:DUF5908 family protein n=1 Tax=Novosphingobium sp. FSW06-99 TaxID=1739113 RepID=UPI0012E35F91|nr:DUF5908 family protein [Novosphingobium sp. FSW06-99]